MVTRAMIADGMREAARLEAAVERDVARMQEPMWQRRALAVFRHAHALRMALAAWQDAMDGDGDSAATARRV